ncbi:hypothetical protein IZ6_28470 [Terrihabitans soli]|uniref:Uncharacterized protein n=1 Tax=Terrihabitans soli TaxID=708113 RepID=A0A6S6QXV2_9HYPH|nr:hypothetical protein [Terrihabitans soli]BCJ92112.1 hypothetical protein IZ6_28470 [Terrihabitans soli]
MLNRLQGKWQTFKYNYGWPDFVFLFDGWLARAAIAIPFIGYLIIFNDYVAEGLSLDILANESALAFGLTASSRLKFIYFGLLLLGVASMTYFWRRPHAIKLGKSLFEYEENCLRHFTVNEYIQIHGNIRGSGYDSFTVHGDYYDSEYDNFLDVALGPKEKNGERDFSLSNWQAAKNKYEGLLRSMLIENYHRGKTSRRTSLTICIVTAALGYALLAVPSVDVFIKVVTDIVLNNGIEAANERH